MPNPNAHPKCPSETFLVPKFLFYLNERWAQNKGWIGHNFRCAQAGDFKKLNEKNKKVSEVKN